MVGSGSVETLLFVVSHVVVFGTFLIFSVELLDLVWFCNPQQPITAFRPTHFGTLSRPSPSDTEARGAEGQQLA